MRAGRFGGVACFWKRAVNQKFDPVPTALLTPIWPSIRSTNPREMASPKPVPPYLRVVEPSACENGWKMRDCAPGSKPMPESMISKSSRTELASALSLRTRRETSPLSVNLIALESRFKST